LEAIENKEFIFKEISLESEWKEKEFLMLL